MGSLYSIVKVRWKYQSTSPQKMRAWPTLFAMAVAGLPWCFFRASVGNIEYLEDWDGKKNPTTHRTPPSRCLVPPDTEYFKRRDHHHCVGPLRVDPPTTSDQMP